MRKNLFPVFFLSVGLLYSQQVGINTSKPHPSAVLDVVSPNDAQGLLIPRLSSAAIQNLSPIAAEGLIVYDKDQHKFLGWNGTSWQNLGYEEANLPPFFSTLPNLSSNNGTRLGSILTTNFALTDNNTSDIPNISRLIRWERSDSSSGVNITTISSAENLTSYTTIDPDDNLKYIRSCVTPISSSGASPGLEKCTDWFGQMLIPVNVAPVANNVNFTGILAKGETLTGSYSYTDADNDTEATSVFEWKTANDATGSNAITIADATSSTYVLTTAEVGKFIQFCVTPKASSGTLTGTQNCSTYKGPVTVPLITGQIAYENFGTSSGAYTSIANSGFGFTSSGTGLTFENTNALFPASMRAISGYGLQRNASSGTGIITSGTIDATTYTNNIELSLRVASFSVTSGNGADSGDYVLISIDTGSGFSDELRLSGNTNSRWDFSSTNTGVASSVYDGNNTVINTAAPASGTVTGANAYSTMKVTGIPNTVKGIKITLVNNDVNEQWVIDEIKLTAQ